MISTRYVDSNLSARVLLTTVIWLSALFNIAIAETVCSMHVRFEHQAETASSQAYRLGIDLSKSLVRIVHGDWRPLGSAKAVWSRNLSYRQVGERTLNIRFGAPCELPRAFSLMACIRAIGRAGTPQCGPILWYTEDASWRVPVRLRTMNGGRTIALETESN